jgi:hypothetical protein
MVVEAEDTNNQGGDNPGWLWQKKGGLVLTSVVERENWFLFSFHLNQLGNQLTAGVDIVENHFVSCFSWQYVVGEHIC